MKSIQLHIFVTIYLSTVKHGIDTMKSLCVLSWKHCRGSGTSCRFDCVLQMIL